MAVQASGVAADTLWTEPVGSRPASVHSGMPYWGDVTRFCETVLFCFPHPHQIASCEEPWRCAWVKPSGAEPSRLAHLGNPTDTCSSKTNGLACARSVRRLAEKDLCDRTLLQSVAGVPWAPRVHEVRGTTTQATGPAGGGDNSSSCGRPIASGGSASPLHSVVEQWTCCTDDAGSRQCGRTRPHLTKRCHPFLLH